MSRMAQALMFLGLIVCLAGCTGIVDATEGAPDPTEEESGIPPGIEVNDEYDADEEVNRWIDTHRKEPGAYQWLYSGKRLVLVAAGEKPTGGYLVKVDKITADEREWVIHVILEAPTPDAAVTQALTYPYALIAMPEDELPVVVKYTASEQTRHLPVLAAGPSFHVTSPIPGTRVTNPLRISGKCQIPDAFKVLVEDGHTILAEGTGRGPQFDFVMEFEEPSNPFGAVILYTENARDGSMTQLIIPVKFQ